MQQIAAVGLACQRPRREEASSCAGESLLAGLARFWLGLVRAASAQDAKQFVQQAVKTELAADAADHSRWLYFEVDRKPDLTWSNGWRRPAMGDLTRLLEKNGRQLSEGEQRESDEQIYRERHGGAGEAAQGRTA